MLFNSFGFALFLPTVLILYWALPKRFQNRFLLVASYVFYGSWDWRFLGLLLLSTVTGPDRSAMRVFGSTARPLSSPASSPERPA